MVTLVPAFLLSLHYGLRGAVLGILAGTALFVLTRVVQTRSGAESDLGAAVVIYGAYGTLVITVGWLSEQLHDHYTTTLERERLAAIGHVAVALRHEVNNALTTIMAESEMLAAGDAGGPAECRAAGRTISDAAARIAADIRKMTNLQTSPVVEYRDGMQMLDLQQAQERPEVTEDP